MALLPERIARALCAHDGQPSEMWERYVPAARAVLDAIREPDAAMLEAGAVVVKAAIDGQSERAQEEDAATIWRYMVGTSSG